MFFYNDLKLTKKRYSACIAIDVIKSESKSNQNKTFIFLDKMAIVLNEKFEKNIVVPFQVRGGDELIGVLNSFAEGYSVFHEVWLIVIGIKGFKIRFGLGLGVFDTLGITNPNEINGSSVISAFRARDKFIKNKINLFYPLSGPVEFYCYSNNLSIPYGSVNALINTMYSLVKTEKHQDLIHSLNRFPNYSYEEIAEILIKKEVWEDLKNSQSRRSNISKMLKRVKYDTFNQLKIDIWNLLYAIQILLDEEWKKINE